MEGKKKSGRVRVEITSDQLKQFSEGLKKNDAITSLMDEHLAAYNRRKREASGEPEVKAGEVPKEFNIRDYA